MEVSTGKKPERNHAPWERSEQLTGCADVPAVSPRSYLQCHRRVLQTVDPEAILQGGTEGRGKDDQLEPLDCRAGVGLAREHIGAQLVQQDVTGLSLQLAVAGGVQGLLIQRHHLLQGEKWMLSCLLGWDESGEGQV